ncbi:30S ribosomal protein S17 [Brevibacterium daeguense]|uniref:Small ribosomal subunit protein uS17 n=1 Tax=Brevibacterium daeguense TaxID=909936 RepID=A0ABP8ELH1_9MICO|nr:30S ribosomal protein S17 [Brevibacterium daeguense]
MAEQTQTGGAAEQVERNFRKTARGYVVSDKMDKTIVVAVEDRKKHRLYGKIMRTTSKIKVHDEENTAGIGDLVVVAETRPLSATKRWRLVEIVERAK